MPRSLLRASPASRHAMSAIVHAPGTVSPAYRHGESPVPPRRIRRSTTPSWPVRHRAGVTPRWVATDRHEWCRRCTCARPTPLLAITTSTARSQLGVVQGATHRGGVGDSPGWGGRLTGFGWATHCKPALSPAGRVARHDRAAPTRPDHAGARPPRGRRKRAAGRARRSRTTRADPQHLGRPRARRGHPAQRRGRRRAGRRRGRGRCHGRRGRGRRARRRRPLARPAGRAHRPALRPPRRPAHRRRRAVDDAAVRADRARRSPLRPRRRRRQGRRDDPPRRAAGLRRAPAGGGHRCSSRARRSPARRRSPRCCASTATRWRRRHRHRRLGQPRGRRPGAHHEPARAGGRRRRGRRCWSAPCTPASTAGRSATRSPRCAARWPRCTTSRARSPSAAWSAALRGAGRRRGHLPRPTSACSTASSCSARGAIMERVVAQARGRRARHRRAARGRGVQRAAPPRPGDGQHAPGARRRRHAPRRRRSPSTSPRTCRGARTSA